MPRGKRNADQADAQKGGKTKPDWTLQIAPAVREVALALIDQHYRNLRAAGILYLFTSRQRKRRGKIVSASTIKLNPLQRFLESNKESAESGADFAIIVDWDEWLGHTQTSWRTALVDHQLAECFQDTDSKGNTKWTLRAPDVVEFSEVAGRHGGWTEDLAEFIRAATQASLPLEAAS